MKLWKHTSDNQDMESGKVTDILHNTNEVNDNLQQEVLQVFQKEQPLGKNFQLNPLFVSPILRKYSEKHNELLAENNALKKQSVFKKMLNNIREWLVNLLTK